MSSAERESNPSRNCHFFLACERRTMNEQLTTNVDPLSLIQPRRRIKGISAVLLPFDLQGEIHWPDFARLLQRTVDAGLTPAVNMDTGYVNLLSQSERTEVLNATNRVLPGVPFVAGAFVDDVPGAAFDLDKYRACMDEIVVCGGTPIVFPSYGLTHQSNEEVVASYQAIGRSCDRFIAFELGSMFAPQGTIHTLEVFRQILQIENCIGIKHSSLDRQAEWQRLVVRNAERPDFHVFTGNDLAIDMVMYGSDYLLGLSTMAPDYFSMRDQYWSDGDPRFYQLNDVLQFLGQVAFRNPTPAYKHSAATFLQKRNWIETDQTHPQGLRRDAADEEILKAIINQLESLGD